MLTLNRAALRNAALAAAITLLAWPITASGTTVLRVSLEKMSSTSDVILHGDVVSSRAVAVDGNARHIRTEVVIRVRQLLKGPAGTKEITLNLPGGRLGDYAMQIPGMPGFSAGEEVVLFLEKTSTSWALTGLGQGKFTVIAGPQGERLVRRQLRGVHFVGFDAQGRFQAVPAPADHPARTVAALLGQVTQHLQTARTAP